MHYQRLRNHGSTADPRRTEVDRFWSQVDAEGICWIWTRAIGADGYGRFGVGRQSRLTHRYAYESLVGPIPDGLQLDHLCRNRACCNPDHLQAVTQLVNVRRGHVGHVNRARLNSRTHCQRGHELTPDNVYMRPDRPSRICRPCAAIREAKRKARTNGQ